MIYLYYSAFHSYNEFDQSKTDVLSFTLSLIKAFFNRCKCRNRDSDHYLYNVNDNLKDLEAQAEGYMDKFGNNFLAKRNRYFIIVEKKNENSLDMHDIHYDMYYYRSQDSYKEEPGNHCHYCYFYTTIISTIVTYTNIMILENPIKEMAIRLSYYDLEIFPNKNENKKNVKFVLKPNANGYYKNMSRQWTFETTVENEIYNKIIETICTATIENLIIFDFNQGLPQVYAQGLPQVYTINTNFIISINSNTNINTNTSTNTNTKINRLHEDESEG